MNKLNLYMIGHKPDAHYLDRLIGQVKPIIESVSFVVTDDSSLGFWQSIFEKHQIPHYLSRCHFESREKFDFSQARNLALDSFLVWDSDWFIWLDCDDTIENPERILEQMKANPGADAYGLPYDVSANQSNIWKVRIHRRDDWQWINTVHEELVPVKMEKPNVTILSDCAVKHSPDDEKSNHDFHLSLLKQACKNAPNEYSYIAKENFNRGRWQEAIDWFKKVIAVHPVEYERFNAHLQTGVSYWKLADVDAAMASLYRAIEVRPYRREPYFFLALIMGELGADWKRKGFAMISACNAQSDFHESGQNGVVYSCAGYKLHARYLMDMGKFEQAHQVMFKAKTLDEEARQIILEIEDELKDAAIAERDKAA